MMKQRSLRISTFVSLSLSLFLQSRPTNAAQLKRKRKKKEGEKGQMVGKKRRNEQKDSETLVTNALYLSRCRIKKTLLFSDTDSLVRVISFFFLSVSLSFSVFFSFFQPMHNGSITDTIGRRGIGPLNFEKTSQCTVTGRASIFVVSCRRDVCSKINFIANRREMCCLTQVGTDFIMKYRFKGKIILPGSYCLG